MIHSSIGLDDGVGWNRLVFLFGFVLVYRSSNVFRRRAGLTLCFLKLSTYPHGGMATAGIFFASLAALIATCYGLASCRFVLLTFTSTQGNFEEYFLYNAREGTDVIQYRVGVGLFQWLRVSDRETQDWTMGVCLGYQQTMRNQISDTVFEAARGFAVLAVLLAFVVCSWGMFTSCLSFHRLQVILLRLLCFCGVLACGMSFLLVNSSMCTSEFMDRRCEIDQGGLIMIGATILWVASFLISIIFVRPETFNTEQTMKQKVAADKERARLVGQIAARRAAAKRKRRAERESQARARQAEESKRNREQLELQQSRSSTEDSVDSFHQRHKSTVKGNDGELEVYVSRRMDRIERIMSEV